MKTVTIIGVDCACQPENVGLARAQWRSGQTTVREVVCAKDVKSMPALIADWVRGLDPFLLALDAPLGWPQPMGDILEQHSAGESILTTPNEMFRRATDRDIKVRFHKNPLDVGADRIARTAHAALSLLGQVRAATGSAIPLAWKSGEVGESAAIEVYPAGTLLAHHMPATGYKKATQRNVRAEMLNALCQKMTLPGNRDVILDDGDCLDAVLCVLAAVDFLAGDAVPPPDPGIARKEGWIWVRDYEKQ